MQVNCSSCGASNQLPEGKSSMFCAFCGTSIQSETKTSNNESKIKSKPHINEDISHAFTTLGENHRRVDGGLEYWFYGRWEFEPDTYYYSLSLIDRDIHNLDEIICWYSDNELEKIESLDLSNNKIKSLKGIKRFYLEELNLSNNNLEYIDELPNIGDGTKFELNFTDNKELKGFSDSAIEQINSYKLKSLNNYLKLVNLKNFNYEDLLKINFNKIIDNNIMSQFEIVIDENEKSKIVVQKLIEMGLKKSNRLDSTVSLSFYSEYWKNISNSDKNSKSIDFDDVFNKIKEWISGLFLLLLFGLVLFFVIKSCSSDSSSNSENETEIIDSVSVAAPVQK